MKRNQKKVMDSGEERRHFESSEGRQDAFAGDANLTRTTGEGEGETTMFIRRPSVRRKRGYSVKLTWTDKMNNDLYDCSDEADKSTYGYSGRLKKLWDQRQQHYKHFESKHLTTEVINLQKKDIDQKNRI